MAVEVVATLGGWKLWTHSRDLRASFAVPGEVLYWLAIIGILAARRKPIQP
ncbi:MAG: hypothetical protein U0636_00240 [Phycisphaerales bacterium]